MVRFSGYPGTAFLPRMNTNEPEYPDALIESVIGCAYEVSNQLGAGFLEKVYERALASELGLRGLNVRRQVPYRILYKGKPVGDYTADMLIENQLIVELKCVERFSNEHMAQCLNYLKAANLRLALLINFQKPKVEWKRIIFG
jgi:GxxExxY protein